MNIESIGLQARNVNELIGALKQGIPADAFDKLRDRLNVTDNLLSRIVQIPKRTLNRRRKDGRLRTDGPLELTFDVKPLRFPLDIAEIRVLRREAREMVDVTTGSDPRHGVVIARINRPGTFIIVGGK